MSNWMRLLAVSVCGLGAGCGGGGGGGGGEDGNLVPTPVFESAGLYGGEAANPTDPTTPLFAQAVITATGRALIYIEEDSSNLAVIDGRLTTSGSDVTLTEATVYLTDEPPAAATGSVQLDTVVNDDIDLRIQVSSAGQTFNLTLQRASASPPSLKTIAGTYIDGIDTDSRVTIDSAGNVIVTQDSQTGCSGTGRVTVDMPGVNAYALSLELIGCADTARNGTYAGRLADDGLILSVIAHSSTRPLFDPAFERDRMAFPLNR